MRPRFGLGHCLLAEAAAVPEVAASLVRELESMDLDHDKVSY